jgi:hypothetical protein
LFDVRLEECAFVILLSLGAVAFGASWQKIRPFECLPRVTVLGMVAFYLEFGGEVQGALAVNALLVSH